MRFFLEFHCKHTSEFDGFFPHGWSGGFYAAALWLIDGEIALPTYYEKAPGLFEAEGGWRERIADWRTATGGERQVSSVCSPCALITCVVCL